jgi:pilus assembly protein Flp/PilA
MVDFATALYGLYAGEGQEGQGLVEYALIIALVAVVVIGTLVLLGPQISSIFHNLNSSL